jgi:hypothetical protein
LFQLDADNTSSIFHGTWTGLFHILAALGLYLIYDPRVPRQQHLHIAHTEFVLVVLSVHELSQLHTLVVVGMAQALTKLKWGNNLFLATQQ